MALQIEQAPIEVDDNVAAYLERMFERIDILFGQVNYFAPRTTVPVKPRIGAIYYFGGAVPSTPISGEGLWLYKSTGWIQLG